MILFPGHSNPHFLLVECRWSTTFKLTGTPDPSKLGASSPGGGKQETLEWNRMGAANMVAGSGVLGRLLQELCQELRGAGLGLLLEALSGWV